MICNQMGFYRCHIKRSQYVYLSMHTLFTDTSTCWSFFSLASLSSISLCLLYFACILKDCDAFYAHIPVLVAVLLLLPLSLLLLLHCIPFCLHGNYKTNGKPLFFVARCCCCECAEEKFPCMCLCNFLTSKWNGNRHSKNELAPCYKYNIICINIFFMDSTLALPLWCTAFWLYILLFEWIFYTNLVGWMYRWCECVFHCCTE